MATLKSAKSSELKNPNEVKAQFVNVFNSLCDRHSRFTVWSDFVHMAAYAISNAYDYRQEREDRYLNIVKRYSGDEVSKITDLFVLTVIAIELDREQDFLGQMYMESGFGNEKNGEYFTPYDIAKLMAEITDDGRCESKSYVTVNDPACGSGVMLIAFANKLLAAGTNHHFKMLAVANDINPTIAMMCYIQLSLLGCAGYVCVSNTITEPMTGDVLCPPEDAFITPLFFHPIWMTRRALKIMRAREGEQWTH